MANIVVTSTANSVLVDFGATPLGAISKGAWRKSAINSFRLETDRVMVLADDGAFEVVYASTTGALIVDSVDGAAPTSLTDLYTKLVALIA